MFENLQLAGSTSTANHQVYRVASTMPHVQTYICEDGITYTQEQYQIKQQQKQLDRVEEKLDQLLSR